MPDGFGGVEASSSGEGVGLRRRSNPAYRGKLKAAHGIADIPSTVVPYVGDRRHTRCVEYPPTSPCQLCRMQELDHEVW